MKNKIQYLTNIIKTQHGVLYIKGKPGTGKSAIVKGIADTNGWNFIDLRLSEVDESDFLVPKVVENSDGTFTTHRSVMDLFRKANERPTLVFFDELNRATQAVKNAALQVLLDRTIGHEFRLNDNVYLVAAGNLGDEDGCEVDEFENALKGRLISFKHELSFPEWVDNYAKEKVHPIILSFLENNLEYLFKLPGENEDAYPSPRSWDFLSTYIVKNYGMNSTPTDWLEDMQNIGYCYVGQCVMKFIRYCQDQLALSINDIINNFPKVAEQVKKLNRDRKSELLTALKAIDLTKYSNPKGKEKLDNVLAFLNLIDPDERMAYLDTLVDKMNINVTQGKTENDKIFKNWLKNFKDTLTAELNILQKNKKG